MKTLPVVVVATAAAFALGAWLAERSTPSSRAPLPDAVLVPQERGLLETTDVPVAVGETPVESWREVNELLAQSVSAREQRAAWHQKGDRLHAGTVEVTVRRATEDGPREVVLTVRRWAPRRDFFSRAAPRNPWRYEIVSEHTVTL